MKSIIRLSSILRNVHLLKFTSFAFVGLLLQVSSFAQTANGKSNQLETQQSIIASIAPYNADVRQAILTVSSYPDILNNIEERKVTTQGKFIALVNDLNQNQQSWIYTLTRYPELLRSLVMLPDGESKNSIMQLVNMSDNNLQDAAWLMYKKHHDLLKQISDLYTTAQEGFLTDINSLDYATKSAFEKIKAMPDVLTLLTNNLSLTEQIGNSYKDQGIKLELHLSALHDSLVIESQYQVTALKEQINQNPEALNEMTQAAQDYAQQNGFQVSSQSNYAQSGNYYTNPYSYWFGYPQWYNSAMWYPGAYWYDMGLYGGFGTGFGLYGFPSYGFSNWFYNPVVYSRYPILYRSFGNYYNINAQNQQFHSAANAGFIEASVRHFNPSGIQAERRTYLTNATTYGRKSQLSASHTLQNTISNSRTAAGAYHGQAWSSQGGVNTYHMNPSSGGGYSGGFRSGGYSGGVSRGNGGRH